MTNAGAELRSAAKAVSELLKLARMPAAAKSDLN